MKLKRVFEPDMENLREIIDISGFDQIEDLGEVGDGWIAKKGVPSHLWKYWKEDLKQKGVNWQRFQSVTSDITWMIESWLEGDTEWNELLEKYADKLDIELE
jgi:hypothetical protein